jgi:pimeloyl-ACP methyl ester carboxylesterase
LTKTLTVLSVAHPAALADASRVDEEQREKSRYVALFLQAGKAEHVLADDAHRRLRAMFALGPNPDAVPQTVIDHFTKSLSRPGRLTAALNYYRANLGAGGGAWAALTQELKITSPTTLLWGSEDPALGRRAVEATAGHVHGPYELVVLEGAGHWLQFERPDEVSRALTRAVQPH